jgi:hypothetical protein
MTTGCSGTKYLESVEEINLIWLIHSERAPGKNKFCHCIQEEDTI